MDGHDVRMLQSGGERDLTLEAPGREARGEVRVQHLDDHAPAEPRILGDEHARHAAAPELALESVRVA